MNKDLTEDQLCHYIVQWARRRAKQRNPRYEDNAFSAVCNPNAIIADLCEKAQEHSSATAPIPADFPFTDEQGNPL